MCQRVGGGVRSKSKEVCFCKEYGHTSVRDENTDRCPLTAKGKIKIFKQKRPESIFTIDRRKHGPEKLIRIIKTNTYCNPRVVVTFSQSQRGIGTVMNYNSENYY